MCKKESIWQRWLNALTWVSWTKEREPNAEEMDETARRILRSEIDELNSRRIRLEKVLAEPERLRNKKLAIQLAEEMQANLHAKRRNPPELSDEEKLAKQRWIKNLTPRSECKHLKGGFMTRWGWDKYAGPSFSHYKDYNVAVFTFPDGKMKIWCLNHCGFVSHPGDANWEKAKMMSFNSTNRASSSEFMPKSL